MVKCYGVTQGATWRQEIYETGSHAVALRCVELRRNKYHYTTSRMGNQVTRVGIVKLTMITILNPDDKVPPVEEIEI